jgi:hypothetical protein
MTSYFGAAAVLGTLALLTTSWLGIAGRAEQHLLVGLVSGILVVGVHTLLIMFVLVTGRVLREAMQARALPADFLEELNRFFAERKAYPIALIASAAVVGAAILGPSASTFGIHPAVHITAGVLAVMVNIVAFVLEARALGANQKLLDRAAHALDLIDRELEARGTPPPPGDEPPDSGRVAHGALIVALSAWLPYFYWALVVWRGDFGSASIHPWIEISAGALMVWLLARRLTPSSEAS